MARTRCSYNEHRINPRERRRAGSFALSRFYEPDLGSDPGSPFRARRFEQTLSTKLLDMADFTLVLVMTQGIGAHLTNDGKRGHLIDLKRDHLIDRVCVQEILPPK